MDYEEHMEHIELEKLKHELADAKFAEFEIEEIEGKRVFVATDETVDREGEILAIDGWQLENFKRNPVLLWSHNPFEPLIGLARNIRMRMVGGKKKMTFEPDFHKKNDLSKLVSDLVDEGYMKTVSVGFRPYQKEGNRYTKQELLEISFVNIPANPEATNLAFSKGYDPSAIKTLIAEADISSKADEQPDTTPTDEIKRLTEEVETLKLKINDLEVAAKAEKPVSEPPQEVTGRSVPSKVDSRKRVKRLVQAANKALSMALALEKQNGHN